MTSNFGYIAQFALCNVPGYWERFWALNAAGATANVVFQPDDPSQFAAFSRVTIGVSGTLTFGNSTINFGTANGYNASRGIQRAGVAGAMAWLAPIATRFDGLSPGATPGTFEATIPLTLGADGLLYFNTPTISFDDYSRDTNGDGRFNIKDVFALSNIIANATPLSPGQLDLWDHDADGMLSAADVDHFQSLINLGIDSGLAGDANQDGSLSCSDRAAAPASPWNAAISSSAYRIQLDLDLDGDNDALDEAAFGQMTLIDIDFNNNGVFPEDQDFIDFFDVIGGAECASCDSIDINQNGAFPEDQDIIDFFDAIAGSC